METNGNDSTSSGVKNGVFKVQPHPLDNDKQFIYYQLKLVATDLCGRSAYQVRNILISSDSASDAAAQRQTSRRERRRKMEVRLSQLSPEESYRMLMRYRRMGRRSETGPEHAPAANFHQ